METAISLPPLPSLDPLERDDDVGSRSFTGFLKFLKARWKVAGNSLRSKLSTVVRVNNSPGNIAGARVSKASGTADDLSNLATFLAYPLPTGRYTVSTLYSSWREGSWEQSLKRKRFFIFVYIYIYRRYRIVGFKEKNMNKESFVDRSFSL